MDADWSELEGINATERILRAALAAGASRIDITHDAEGATVIFQSQDRLEVFTHVPANCREEMYAYVRRLAGIDVWEEPPVEGACVFCHGEETHCMDVALRKGMGGTDLVIRLAPEGR